MENNSSKFARRYDRELGRRDGRAGTTQRNPPVQVVEVNAAAVSGSNAFLPGEILSGKHGRKSAEAKALARFKRRVKEITARNRGHRVQDVLDELQLYVTGWMNYFGISHSYKVVLELAEWVRRGVRLYYWKQWKQSRTRRRHLIALGANPAEVHMATRSRKGYWRMSSKRIVQQALSNRWLEEQGVPNLSNIWIVLHYGSKARV